MSAQPKVAHKLVGKKAILIGGSSGIGFGVASALIEEGASIVVASSSEEKVKKAVERLSDPSLQYNADTTRIQGLTVNVAGPESEASLEALFKNVGEFDFLIFSAGDERTPVPLDQVTYEVLSKAGDIRVFAVVLAAKHAKKYMRPGGCILTTGGVLAHHPRVGWSSMAIFLAGLEGLVRQLAVELSPLDLRVNNVCPGPVLTELFMTFPEEMRNQFLTKLKQETLTNSIAKPEHIAQTYLGILKDPFITGQTVLTEGGGLYGPRPE